MNKIEKILWRSIPKNRYVHPRPNMIISRMVTDGLIEFPQAWAILRKWVEQGRYEYNPSSSIDNGWKVSNWRWNKLVKHIKGPY